MSNMAKNKFDFIAEMLEKKGLSPNQKERLYKLIAQEIRQVETADSEILKRIEDIELKLNGNKKNPHSKQGLHDPMNTVRFLTKFSHDDTFKYFTHKQEAEFNYDDLIQKAQSDFNKTLNIETINVETWQKVNHFCFPPKEGYSTQWKNFNGVTIKFGWAKVKEWCSLNNGTYPDIMELPTEPNEIRQPDSANKDFVLMTFGDIIKQFKHTIELRQDDRFKTFDQHLKSLVRLCKMHIDFDVEYKGNFNEVTLYSDIHLLLSGIKIILEQIIEYRANSTKVRFELADESEEVWKLKIIHVNSRFNRSKSDDKLLKGGGTLGEIRKKFFCICDWELFTILNDSNIYRIEMLNENVNDLKAPVQITESNEQIEGVTHIIKLYKTTNL